MHSPLRFLLAVWLALAFPLGQHAALGHALGHATDVLAGQQDSTPAPEKCPDHSLYTAFAGALGVAACATPLIAAGAPPFQAALPRDASLAPRLAFLTRAPPASPASR